MILHFGAMKRQASPDTVTIDKMHLNSCTPV